MSVPDNSVKEGRLFFGPVVVGEVVFLEAEPLEHAVFALDAGDQ